MSINDAMSEQRAFSAAVFRRGAKRELFDDKQEADEGWDEATELREKLGDLHALWSAARTGRDMSAAIWRHDLGVAELVMARGKLFSHMGYTQGSKHYLHIEEAVYMVDRTNLLLFLEPRSAREQQRLLSLQEAYDLMVGCGFSTEQYLVYAKLMRAGYIVQRYPARWVLKITERPREVWHRWYQQPAAAAAAAAPEASTVVANRSAPAAMQQPAAGPLPTVRSQPAPPVAPGGGGTLTSRDRKRKLQQAQHGSWWQQAAAGSLPWLSGLPVDFVDGLPRCEVAPDSHSKWAGQFPAMAPLATLTHSQLQAQGQAGAEEEGHDLLDFDVFEPNSKFARRTAGPPSFRVAVLRAGARAHSTPHDMFVGLEQQSVADRASPGVPVKFVTVEEGDVAFYGLGCIELRSILSG